MTSGQLAAYGTRVNGPPPLLYIIHRDTRVSFFILLFYGGRSQLVVELDHSCEVSNLFSAQVGIGRITYSK